MRDNWNLFDHNICISHHFVVMATHCSELLLSIMHRMYEELLLALYEYCLCTYREFAQDE